MSLQAGDSIFSSSFLQTWAAINEGYAAAHEEELRGEEAMLMDEFNAFYAGEFATFLAGTHHLFKKAERLRAEIADLID